MSVLQKGLLTVFAVTAVASSLILFTGKNATAEADNASHSVNASNLVDKSLHSKRSARTSNTSDKNVLLKEVSDDDHLQQKSPNKTFVPAFSLSPPPIGPFQVARPSAYGLQRQATDLSVAFDNKQRESTAVTIPYHNAASLVAPIMKKMNQLAPQPPKEMRSQPLKPERQVEKMIAPVNRLVEPLAPVQKIPKRLSVPPAAPVMQRYMYVPPPAQMHQQVPKEPMTGVGTTILKVPATKTNPNSLHKNIQQPTLQPNK